MGIVKGAEWLIKKYGNGEDSRPPAATLAPEQSRQLREVHEKFISLEKDIGDMKRDNDKIADAMTKVADCIQKVAESNEKVAELVEKIDRRQEIEDEIRKRQMAMVVTAAAE